jgi:hypothetical protein
VTPGRTCLAGGRQGAAADRPAPPAAAGEPAARGDVTSPAVARASPPRVGMTAHGRDARAT